MHLTIKLAVVTGLAGAIVAAVAGRFDTAAAHLAFQWGIGTMFASLGVLFVAMLIASRGSDLVCLAADVVEFIIRVIFH